MVELGLPLGFAVEVDALYHRTDFDIGPPNEGPASDRANSWEFPVLLKYKLGTPLVKPFVEAGLSPRTISGKETDVYESVVPTGAGIAPATLSYTFDTNWKSSLGIVLGGGVQFGLGPLRISPEVRYTHWTSTPINETFADGPTIHSTQEQADILVGLAWKVH
jgi:hypothetical protein